MGDIVADPARGAWTGNRGPLAVREGELGRARWKIKPWIICVLHWKGNRQPLMQPRTWTPLFFLDEATALAAGHRPCAYCRRDAFMAYAMAARPAGRNDRLRAPEIDAQLHEQRLTGRPRRKRLHRLSIDDLPTGAMFLGAADSAWLIAENNIRPWSFAGYGPPETKPRGVDVDVITPPLSLTVLRNGFRPG
jgi:hypothetical protein